MGYPEAFVAAIQAGTVGIGAAAGDQQRVAVGELHGNAVKGRAGEGVVRVGRAVGVESQHGKHRPGAHGAGVVVAGKAVRRIFVVVGQNPFYRAPSPFFLAFEAGEQVRIHDVGLVGGVVQAVVEYLLQPFQILFAAAHQTGIPFHVVRHGKRIVPGTAFVETGGIGEVGPVRRVEGGEERAVGPDGPKAAVLGAVVVPVAQRAALQPGRVFFIAQRGRKLRQGIVGQVVFQGVGDRVVTGEVGREIAQRDVAEVQIRVVVGPHPVLGPGRVGALEESFVGLPDVEILHPLEPGVGDHADGRVSFHGPGFPAEELPFGHPPPFPVHVHHGTHHVQLLFRIEQGEQWMQVAVGVP